MSLTENELWSLMEAFFRERGLVRQHLDSYNEFIEHGLQEIIDEVGEIQIEIPEYPFKIKLGKIEVGKPRIVEVDGSDHPIYPMEARLRNLTYAAPMELELTEVHDGKESPVERVYIGDVPIMLKSAYCALLGMSPEELIEMGEDPKDPGGYFIINGSERVIVALEDLAPNRVLIDVDRSGSSPIYRAKVFSTTVGFRARIELRMKSDGALYVSMPGVPTEIPFVVMMRALGFESDRKLLTLFPLTRKFRIVWSHPLRRGLV